MADLSLYTGNRSMKKKKVLLHAPILEYPPRGGPEVSVINAIKALSVASDLHITTSVSKKHHTSAEVRKFLSEHCIDIEYLPSSFVSSENVGIDKQLVRLKRVLAPIFALIDVYFIIRMSKRYRIKILWIDRVLEKAFFILFFLRKLKPAAFIVGDTEAVHSRFISRELPMISNIARKGFVLFKTQIAKRQERSLMKLASSVTAVSELDAEYFRALSDHKHKVKLFSNTVDISDFVKVPYKSDQKATQNLLLMGSFGSPHSPMDRAAKWLANDIMPIVWEKVPSAHLYIVGKGSKITQSHLNGSSITVVGEVESMTSYLKLADICVIPLHYESGTRFKIIQAGAASLPCISTTLGAEGLNVEDGNQIIIRDKTEDFALAVIELLMHQNHARKIGDALGRLVANTYSLDVQKREALEILSTES